MSETLNLPWITVGYHTPTGSPTKSRKERLNVEDDQFCWGSSHLFLLIQFLQSHEGSFFPPPRGRWGCGHDQFRGGEDPSHPAGWGGRNWTWRQRKQHVLKILALVDDGWWLLMLKRKFSLSFFIVWAGWLEDVHIFFFDTDTCSLASQHPSDCWPREFWPKRSQVRNWGRRWM